MVGLQRLGLTAGTVEREHQLSPKPLSQRMLRDERLELGSDIVVPAEREVSVDALLDRGET